MCNPHRRRFISRIGAGSLLLAPLAANLAGCSSATWPEGMKPIAWDRDACVRCNMRIADHRFAAQLRGGPRDNTFNFDDVGCLVFWLEEQRARFPWMDDASTRMWVAAWESPGSGDVTWLDPRQARYVVKRSPMRYDLAASAGPAPDTPSLSYEEMRQKTLARGK
ncbi:MAG: hypothetical protein ACYCWL_12765 [Thauera sp.]